MFSLGSLNINGLSGGQKVTSAADTATQITSTETAISAIVIQAKRTNTGNVTIGGSDVSNTAGSESGIELVPGEIAVINTLDVNMWYIASDVSGDGIQYLLLKG